MPRLIFHINKAKKKTSIISNSDHVSEGAFRGAAKRNGAANGGRGYSKRAVEYILGHLEGVDC